MKKELYLHIGSHKTGSSSIQSFLSKNTELLSKHDTYYFNLDLDNNKVNNGNMSIWLASSDDIDLVCTGKGLRFHNLDIFKEKLKRIPHSRIVFSAESLSYCFDHKEIEKIYNSLREDFLLKVVMYIRRQDRLAVSHLQQGAKFKNSAAGYYYQHDGSALPKDKYYYYLDFYSRYLDWSGIFGTDNIIVRIFERSKLYKSDVVHDFLNILNIQFSGDTQRVNESVSKEVIKLGHMLNSFDFGDEFRNAIVRKLLKNQNRKLKYIPSRCDAINFYDTYREGNILLNKLINVSNKEDIFEDDFRDYPVESNESWDENSASLVITELLTVLQNFSILDAELLRDTAIAMEKFDINISYNLMSVAAFLRPHGPAIRKKLEYYQSVINSTQL